MQTTRHVGFWEAVGLAFRNYFNFRGRAQRQEFWWFMLFTTVAGLVLDAIDTWLFSAWPAAIYVSPSSTLFSLATLIPSLSLGARRLHDIGRTGWWQALPLGVGVLVGFLGVATFASALDGGASASDGLFAFVMIGGFLSFFGSFILLIVWWCFDSERGDNRYGPSPKYGSQAAVFD